MTFGKLWNVMSNKIRFDPFFHAKFTLWRNPTKNWGKGDVEKK